ncbi:MAG: cell division protein FtsZ [Candidatus Hodarchaeales archaeon]|jgi:cell division protein FtsZ
MSDFPIDLQFQMSRTQKNSNSRYHSSDPSKTVFDADEDIEEYLRSSLPKVQVIGVGGGGNNSVNRLMEMGIQGAESVAINTDAQHLLSVKADKKLLIGSFGNDRGIGAGNDPAVGRTAAIESSTELIEVLDGDLVFITCGLGGGTGTGAAPVIAELASKAGSLVISICTLPFGMEGLVRKKNASNGLEKIQQFSDMVVLVPNETLLRIFPNVSVLEGLAIANEVLVKAVRGITELITTPQLVNLDFSDVRKVVEESGVGLIGVGEAEEGPSQSIDVVSRALSNPLLEGMNPAEADRALVYVAGGPNFSIGAADEIVRDVRDRINPDAELIWGASVETSLSNRVRMVVIISSSRKEEEELGDYAAIDNPISADHASKEGAAIQEERKGILAGIKAKISRKNDDFQPSNEKSSPARVASVYEAIEEPAERLENLPVHHEQEIFVFSSGGVPLAHLSPSWPRIVETGDPTMITGLFSAVQDMADNFIENGGVNEIVTGNKKCIFAAQTLGDSDFIRGVAVIDRHGDEKKARVDLMQSIQAVSNLLRENIPEWEVSDRLSKGNFTSESGSIDKNCPQAS